MRRPSRSRVGGWLGLVLAAMTGAATLTARTQPAPASGQSARPWDCPSNSRWDHTYTRIVIGNEIHEHKNCVLIGPALHQARVAAANANQAACVFDGSKLDCGKPVTLVTVSASPLPVPADAAAFIKGIDPKDAANPMVQREIGLSAHMAGVRGRARNTLVADTAAYNTRPTPGGKNQVDADKAQLNIAASDEAAIKTTIGGMVRNLAAGHPANYQPEPVVPVPGSH